MEILSPERSRQSADPPAPCRMIGAYRYPAVTAIILVNILGYDLDGL